MQSDIVVAIISGLCVAVPSIIATISANKKNNDLVLYRINELDNKVHEHNQLIDRMYRAESNISALVDDVKEIKRKVG